MSRNVLVLIGPHPSIYDVAYPQHIDRLISNLKAKPINIHFAGDGKTPLNRQTISSKLSELSKSPGKLTVMVYINGKPSSTEMLLDISGKEHSYGTNALFTEIAKAAQGKPVDVLITGGDEHSALRSKDLLPKGSTVACLGDFFGNNTKNLTHSLEHYNGSFTAHDLVNRYMCTALADYSAPTFGVSGQDGEWLPHAILESQLRQPWTPQDHTRVSKALEGYMSPAEIKSAISCCEHAQTFRDVDPKQYGQVLAVCLARIYDPEKQALIDFRSIKNRLKTAAENTGDQPNQPGLQINGPVWKSKITAKDLERGLIAAYRSALNKENSPETPPNPKSQNQRQNISDKIDDAKKQQLTKKPDAPKPKEKPADKQKKKDEKDGDKGK